jgi:hypothetical protein
MKPKYFIIIPFLLLAAGCSQQPQSNHAQPLPVATNQQNNTMDTQQKTQNLMAIVQVMDYGFSTKIYVNGQDIGWGGPGGGGVRLFNKENSDYASATPDVLKQNGVLKLGKNTIKVVYTKTDRASTDKLQVEFKMQGYSDDLFNLQGQDIGGTVEQTIDVEPTQPADFKPIVIVK